MVDDHNSDFPLPGSDAVGPDAMRTVAEMTEASPIIVACLERAFFEEEIIRRIAAEIANGGDREKVYALAVELVAAQNE